KVRYEHYPGDVEGHKTREQPGESLSDFFSPPRLFWNSMTDVEKELTIKTFSYHLGYVNSASVRQQTVDMCVNVDRKMACQIADNTVVVRPEGQNVDTKESSPILSESNMPSSPYSQKVGILLKDGFS